MSYLTIFFIACFASSATKAQNMANGSIGFPEVEENPDLKNKDNRQPVFIPAKCPANELYYPGDQKDDWICDCRPAHLYHPASDACWPAYQKGPCSEGSYLKLPENSVIPICEENPCRVTGSVMWNGKCQRLGSGLPCDYMYPTRATLGVNATTLAISCVELSFESRFGKPSPRVVVNCPPGCKRSIRGKCVTVVA